VLPLDDRTLECMNAAMVGRPDLMAGRASLTVHQGMTGMSENVFIDLKKYRARGRDADGERVLREALRRVLARHPYDPDTLAALIAYAHAQGRPREALSHARRRAELEPSNSQVRQLVRMLGDRSPPLSGAHAAVLDRRSGPAIMAHGTAGRDQHSEEAGHGTAGTPGDHGS
jgi:hypothetical protein